MSCKLLLFGTVMSVICLTVSGQDTVNPKLVDENKMESSSAVFPFTSRELALSGDYGVESEYIVPLEDWTKENVEDGVKFSSRFKVPYRWSDRVVLLRIEGVSNSFSVDVNNKYAGYSQSGIGRSQFNLTKLSQENYNTLSITIFNDTAAGQIEDSRSHDVVGFDKAYIIAQPKVRIKDLYVNAEYDNGTGLFSLGAVMESHLINSKEFKIFYELLSPSGEKVAYGDKILQTQMYSQDSVYFFARIPSISSWTHEAPVLYTLVVKTQYEGRFKEYVVGKVGFTDFDFLSDGSFTVNGSNVALIPQKASWKGNYKETELFLNNLKSSGCTLVLVEGHPQPDEFYTICDRIGLYVCNQADIGTIKSGSSRTKGGNPSNNPDWTDAYVDRAVDMYMSSKNHPSVIAFSLANEGSSNGIALYEAYVKLKSLESERPIYYASAQGEWNTDNIRFDDDAQISVGGVELVTDRAGDGVLILKNTSEITTFYLKAEYTTRRGAVKYSISNEDIVLVPQQSLRCNIPLDGMTPGKQNNKLDVIVYDANATFEFDASIVKPTSKVLFDTCIGFYNSSEL